MYSIICVDDEPAALKHICMIIEKKCPNFKIIDTAGNGKEAFEKINLQEPDILISDVKMPIMDGIKLISEVKKDFPEILSVIVSGHQDFEYAKGALKSGASDYLLKPLKPNALKELLEELCKKLDLLYYEKQKSIVWKLCNGSPVNDFKSIKKYFPDNNYYSAIIRQNGLPKRFSTQTGTEFYSMQTENFFIYGRDEMEDFYLFSENLMFDNNFEEIIKKAFDKKINNYTYVTAVVYEKPFSIENLNEIGKQLYRKLDESIIIGKNRFLRLEEISEIKPETLDKEKLSHIEYLIKYKEIDKLIGEVRELFTIWEEMKATQLYVETQVRYLFYLLNINLESKENTENIEFLIDDAFYYALSMKELSKNTENIILDYTNVSVYEKTDDKLKLFNLIIAYIENNLSEAITINSLCEKFALSQTLLSKMFRKYSGCSFNKFLTQARIEKAKAIMKNDPEVFIKDVAERVGYIDQFYFSRLFRSITGVCPSEYISTSD